MIVVLDTSVIISGQIMAIGYERQLFNFWKDGQFNIALSPALISEYQRVLEYPKIQKYLKWSSQDVGKFVSDLRKSCVFVSGTTPVTISPDPFDNMLFSCALEAQAD